ncbi:hypothetical protein FDH82_gp44 [Roseobacter phage RDJL Phi 2]|uniref:Uncharacterized protein n=1 Tax=Roseobacter phage RDJL Phi 2 TaxID=1682380 RepID=A0A0K0PVT3_9CAUD|nr:hypothetical protein FDH82_gp44 [Roseobacter phage RDJL Phi 2]AKQ75834.1 hypothetical protein RDJLphi2_gp44 [Roseobacter phage RDJL Phi 2]
MSGPVFVFGSNLAGKHGRGAALFAKQFKGAQQGVGVGRTGNAYALPTKDEKLRVLPWSRVEQELRTFRQYAKDHSDEWFELTPVGTGLAGHRKKVLIKFLRGLRLPPNVLLSPSFLEPGP